MLHILVLLVASLHPVLPAFSPAAQTPGFVNIGTVAFGTNTFTDSTNCKPSTTCAYELTSFNAAGESGPSNIVTVTWGSSNKSTTLTWTPPATGGTPTGYNVYFLAAPSAPTGLTGTVN
jgi:hypothetical protein